MNSHYNRSEYYDRHNDQSQALLVLFLLLIGGVGLLVFQFSQSIGADFTTTLNAVLRSAVILGLVGFLVWAIEAPLYMGVFVFPFLAWPCWWSVLDTIANGGRDPEAIRMLFLTQPWYVSSWFEYGVEAAFIILAVYAVKRSFQWY